MEIKKKIHKASVAVLAFGLSAYDLLAQEYAKKLVDAGTRSLKNTFDSVVNFVSILILLISAAMLGWVYLRKSGGDQQSDDALKKWAWGLLIVMIFLQVIKGAKDLIAG